MVFLLFYLIVIGLGCWLCWCLVLLLDSVMILCGMLCWNVLIVCIVVVCFVCSCYVACLGDWFGYSFDYGSLFVSCLSVDLLCCCFGLFVCSLCLLAWCSILKLWLFAYVLVTSTCIVRFVYWLLLIVLLCAFLSLCFELSFLRVCFMVFAFCLCLLLVLCCLIVVYCLFWLVLDFPAAALAGCSVGFV